MTNYEFYKDKIEEIEQHNKVGIKDGVPVKCEHIDCDRCQRYKRTCSVIEFMNWALAEHEETKINLPSDIAVDTPILVSNSGECWRKRYFARYSDDGKVLAFYNGATSWSTNYYGVTDWNYAKLPEEEQKNE